MGKLCFESVTKLIGQLILLAKYGGPEVRDVKCSQRIFSCNPSFADAEIFENHLCVVVVVVNPFASERSMD